MIQFDYIICFNGVETNHQPELLGHHEFSDPQIKEDYELENWKTSSIFN